MRVVLPNGRIIENVPKGTSKDEIRRKAIQRNLAVEEDFMTPAEVSERAVRNVGKDMGVMDRLAVGVGRGLADVRDSASQLIREADDATFGFGRRVLGLTPEESRKRDAAELETYETGLGDSTAASVGRFIGQTAPAGAAGFGAGTVARAAGTRALPTLAAEGAAAGAVEGAATQAGGTAEDILKSAGAGGLTGAVAAPLLDTAGRWASGRIDELDVLETLRRAGLNVRKLPRDEAGNVDFTHRAFLNLPNHVIDRLSNPRGGGFRAARERVGDSLKSIPRNVEGLLKEDFDALDLLGAGIGFTQGGVSGAVGGLGVSRGAKALAPTIQPAGLGVLEKFVGDGAERTFRRSAVTNYVQKYLPEFEQAEEEKGPIGAAAKANELTQTDPIFRAQTKALQDMSNE